MEKRNVELWKLRRTRCLVFAKILGAIRGQFFKKQYSIGFSTWLRDNSNAKFLRKKNRISYHMIRISQR